MQLGSAHCYASAVVLGVLLTAAEMHAQRVDTIASSVACTTCRIHLAPVVTIGTRDGPAALGPISDMAVLSDGRMVLSHDYAAEEIMVFSPSGDFLQRVGRKGKGPGEFGFVRWMRPYGDRLYAFDPFNRRVTVFSADFRVLRTIDLEGEPLWDAEVVSDSLFVVNALIRSRSRMGFLLHTINASGQVVNSMTEASGGYRFDLPGDFYFRSLEPSSTVALWAAHRTQFRIDEVGPDGTLRRSIVRHAEWFPDHFGGGGKLQPQTPRKPRVLDLRDDGEGRLWILVRVAAEDWADALKSPGPGAHPELGSYVIADLNRAYDTVLEIIDLNEGTLLASQKIDQAMIQFIGDDLVYSYSEVDDIPRVHVWRLSINQGTSRRIQ